MIFVKVLKNAETWDQEAEMIQRLRKCGASGDGGVGVAVVPGRHYGGIDGEKGWIRMLFAVKEEVMKEALERMEGVLRGES